MISSALSSLLFALGTVGVAAWIRIYSELRTGDPKLDRIGIRGGVALAAIRVFGPKALADGAAIPKALIAIVHEESRGDPRRYLGDTALLGGPSIGPGQVYRSTAVELGLWSPPEGVDAKGAAAAYARLATDEPLLVLWSAKVFKQKLRDAGGDLSEAIRRYNGGGSAAEAYRADVLAWAASIGWRL